MILVFWMLSFKPTFSLFSFTLIKKLLTSFLLSATRVVSSAYLRLLIFLHAILIQACASSSPAFHMMYSTYKLYKQGDNIQLWCIPFLIWNQSVPCPILTVVSWLAYRIFRRQIWLSGIPISLRIFYNLLWFTESKTLVNEAEVDVFLEFPCFLPDATNLMSDSSASSKPSLYTWKFLVHIVLKPSL